MPLDQDEDPGPIPPLTQHRKFYPQLFRRALSDQQQQFYKQHGHLLLLKTLQLEIKTELLECQQLWEQFSPHQSLFDSWQFRLAFWHGYQFQPYFIVLKNQTGVLGVLPLWFNSELKQYEWFGSPWHEDNRFFVSDPVIIPLLLAAAPTPTILNAIAASAIFPYEKVISFQPDEPKYLIDLTKVASLDDFLDSLKKKKRYNLRRDFRLISQLNPTVTINHFADYQEMVRLNKLRFADRPDPSDWDDPRKRATFEKIMVLGMAKDEFEIRVVSVRIGGQVAGVDVIALYQGGYYALKGGYDIKRFSGVGNYMNLIEIEDALSLGMKKIDFLEGSYNWKESMLSEVKLFKYLKL